MTKTSCSMVAARQLRPARRQWTGGTRERRHRRHAVTGHAAFAGDERRGASGLVVTWRPQPREPSVRRRRTHARPQPHLLQQARRRRPARAGLRRRGAPRRLHDGCARRTREADYDLCGPTDFMHGMSSGLAARGVPAERILSEIFSGGKFMTPGMVGTAPRAPHLPSGAPGSGPLWISPRAVSSPGRLPTNPSRLIARPRAICSLAARNPNSTW